MRRLTCREVILECLDEYVDGILSPEVVEEFERHLSVCPPCVAYLNTYKRTRELARRTGSVDLPEDMKDKLREFLLARLAAE